MDGYRPRVLIVEDDTAARNILSLLLESVENLPVEVAENGLSALKILNEKRVDIAIIDIMMPKMDGYELIRRIRENPRLKELYIIVTTALFEPKDRVKGLDLGANDYVTKPFNHTELLARVRVGVRTVKLQRELNETNESLKRVLEIKEFLLHRVAHDLRSPLNIVNGYLDLIREEISENAKLGEYVSLISKQISFINGICEDILNYSLITKGKYIRKEQGDVKEILQEAVELNIPYALKKEVKVETNLSEVPRLSFDPLRLKSALWNVINNAIKYSYRGGTVKVSLFAEGEGIKVLVQDEGVGIKKEEEGDVFKKFRSASGGYGGERVGLGLVLTKKIIEDHGGSIFFKSSKKGTTFFLTIPLGLD